MPKEVHANLARHEALLDLITHLNRHAYIPSIAQIMAAKIKYVASVFSWRFIIPDYHNAFVIDAFRNKASITSIPFNKLSEVELRFWQSGQPGSLSGDELAAAKPLLASHLSADYIRLIYGLPSYVSGETRSLFLFSSRQQKFSPLDLKFAGLIAGQFYDKVEAIRAQERFNAELTRLVGDRTRDLVETNRKLQSQIAERHKVEEQIRALNAELEGRVEARTGELKLSNEQLRESKLVAEAALRAKSEFLARLSHEIRTPMHGVLGMADLLLRADLPDEHAECVATIRRSGNHLLTMIDDILDLAKMEAGRMEVHEVPFDLRVCVQDVVDLFSARALDKQLWLRGDIDRQLPSSIVSDVTRIRQILYNLVSNALKFTERGGVLIRVCARAVDDRKIGCSVARPDKNTVSDFLSGALQAVDEERIELLFAVRDTGVGIPQEAMDRLFLPYSQLDSSTATNHGGTGLGLAICSNLASLMGGRIWAESKEGEGSCFFFTIQVRRGRTALAGARSHCANGNQPHGKLAEALPLRILVAEDNPMSQRLAERMFQHLGYSIDVVSNGVEVLGALEQKDYDVVLMDCHMPKMNGYEAARRIAKTRGDPRSPRIIALTANSNDRDREKCLRAGMDDYLTKPIRMENLIAVLQG